MKHLIIAVALLFIACEGKLTEEQRRKMREQMELHKIKRVTESELTEAAYAKGRQIISSINAVRNDSAKLDSVLALHSGRVRFIMPGTSNALDLERQLVEAYLADESGAMQDNIQKLRRENMDTDSILYTMPSVTKLDDGTERLDGIWNIWLSRKQLILEMDK